MSSLDVGAELLDPESDLIDQLFPRCRRRVIAAFNPDDICVVLVPVADVSAPLSHCGRFGSFGSDHVLIEPFVTAVKAEVRRIEKDVDTEFVRAVNDPVGVGEIGLVRRIDEGAVLSGSGIEERIVACQVTGR